MSSTIFLQLGPGILLFFNQYNFLIILFCIFLIHEIQFCLLSVVHFCNIINLAKQGYCIQFVCLCVCVSVCPR